MKRVKEPEPVPMIKSSQHVEIPGITLDFLADLVIRFYREHHSIEIPEEVVERHFEGIKTFCDDCGYDANWRAGAVTLHIRGKAKEISLPENKA